MRSIISGHSFRELLDHFLFNAHRKYIASLSPLASTQTVVLSTSQVQVRSMPSLTPSFITVTSEKLLYSTHLQVPSFPSVVSAGTQVPRSKPEAVSEVPLLAGVTSELRGL